MTDHTGRLREIASRYGAASTSPWRWDNDGLHHSGQMQYLVLALSHPYLTQSRSADLELIENAPADIAYLLNLVAQLELDLSRAEQQSAEIREAVTVPQPLRQFEQQIEIQPALDRAAKLEAALEVVAAREALNRAELDARPQDQHTMCAAEMLKIRGEFNRAADEVERLRGIVRSMEADHAARQARWQPQINELTIERDAASRQLAACRDAQTELERQLREANEELHTLRSSDALEAVAAHAGLRDLIGRFETDGGGLYAAARVPVAALNAWRIVVGDQDTERSTKRIAMTPPPAGGAPRYCRGYVEVDEGYFVHCDQVWPHQRVTDPENGQSYDHCNLTEGTYFNQRRAQVPAIADDSTEIATSLWTLGHVRQFLAAYPDWADDQPVEAVLPLRPSGWAHDGSGLYQNRLLGLTMDDPRDFL